MSLLITQGKQDTSKDNKYEAIETEYVKCKIDELKRDTNRENTLNVRFKILEGQYKNRVVYQSIQYAATDKLDMTWKYRQLRKAVGNPYKEDEPVNIDIEAVLLNRALSVKFTKTADKEDKTKFYQNATFKSLDDTGVVDVEDIKIVKPTHTKKATAPVAAEPAVIESNTVDETPANDIPTNSNDNWDESEWA